MEILFAMKAYDPKTAIANRLRGQTFTINNEKDEKAMLEDIIRAASSGLEEYILESYSLHHDEYTNYLNKTVEEVYNFYLPQSATLSNVSTEYIKNQIIKQLNEE